MLTSLRGCAVIELLSPLPKHSFQSESDRLLVVEALRIAASHWNATARAVAEQDRHHDIAAKFEERAIEALQLASEIEEARA